MSRFPSNQLIVPSILDRLIDDDPHGGPKTSRSRYQTLRELKMAVQRDLQNLLNTRWRSEFWPSELKILKTSAVNYGMPDFANENFDDQDKRDNYVSQMEQVIRQFEPRLEQVRVQLIYDPEATDRTIRFRIQGMIKADPSPESVVYDSEVEPTTGNFEVKATT